MKTRSIAFAHAGPVSPAAGMAALTLAAISRPWSTVPNGMAIVTPSERGEADLSLRIAGQRGAKQ